MRVRGTAPEVVAFGLMLIALLADKVGFHSDSISARTVISSFLFMGIILNGLTSQTVRDGEEVGDIFIEGG